VKYSKAVKLTIQEVQGLIQQFATTTLESIEARTQQTQGQLAQQMSNMEKFFVQADTSKEGDDNRGDSIVTYKQFQALENKVDQLIMLQKDLVAKIFEMNQAAKKKAVPKKVTRKPAPNPLKFP
jgi:Tfp pilus assembly protein PilE